ncbi:Nucleoporin NUP152 [Ceratocystis fimbriata CBS 114723]|uniref:Nucleoporin NUP152 n=1 Tax=Ceratocystis fimbriata CBS 114723 TaxID=1035309 RepID=A0A2C5X5D4_9PEZI|nr:Nucleoporin NUP152 [Ceratocystis fimbriata CBS 114723]
MDLNTTPRARPALKFANRVYTSTPNSSSKRLSTFQSSSRKAARFDDSTLSHGAGNIFRASTLSAAATPSSSRFEPTIPNSTLKKSFSTSVVSATPKTQRVYRETVAKFTPRGMAAHSAPKELFDMRIPSPPLELNGEELTKRVPRDMERKGTVYADQYLGHVVPREFDDLQRRQFFCILDLRRLKYAANEVFAKKDWKLNIINFAKEFEKSRSLILLRYGLYEFQNVKPSDDVLRRWKISHGLPVEDEDEQTPVKSSATGSKRKAEDDIAPEKSNSTTTANGSKRRIYEDDEATSKRKTDASEEQPRKILKPSTSTPSATRALFEKIASKTATTESTEKEPAAGSSSLFESTVSKPASNPFSKTVTSDTKNDSSSVTVDDDAPAEKPTVKKTWTPDTPIKFAPAAAATSSSSSLFGSSTPAAATPTAASLFGQKPAATAPIAASSTSLFGAKKSEEKKDEEPEKPKSIDAPVAPLFGAKPAETTPKSLFGSTPAAASTTSSLFGSKVDTPSTTATSSLFGAGSSVPDVNLSKPETTAPAPAASTTSLFGGVAAKPSLTSSATTPNLFGGVSSAKPVESSSTLAKVETPSLPSSTSVPSLFGAAKSDGPGSSILDTKTSKPVDTPKPLFGNTAAATPATSGGALFGSTASVPASTSLFGSSKPSLAPPATFDFSGAAKTASSDPKPLFGGNPIEGSPMKQDSPVKRSLGDDSMQQDSPPASKKLFGAAAPSTASAFSFGAAPATTTPSATFNFGASQTTRTNSQPSTGGSGLFGGSSGFSFGSGSNGGASTNSSFTNPFSQASATTSVAAPAAPTFNFGAASSTSTPATSFQFGGSSSQDTNESSGGNMFSFNASSAKPNSTRATTPLPPGKRPTLVPKSLRGRSNSPAVSQGNTSSLPNPFANGPGANTGASFNFGANDTNGNKPTPQFQFGNSTPANDASKEVDSNGGTTPSATATTTTKLTGTAEVPAVTTTTATTETTSASATAAPTETKTTQPKSLFGSVGTAATSAFSLATAISTPETATPLASTPATGTDDAEAPQEQINLTEGGPGEEEEEVVYEVRAKMLLFVKDEDAKSPWSTQGVGPLRVLKHKVKGTVRMLLRREPSGHVAFNRALLSGSKYEATGKTVKLITTSATGSGFETWIATVKTPEAAKALAEALETHKVAVAKKD